MGRKVKTDKIICGIYAIICTVTWQSYVGSSNDILLRLENHFSNLKTNTHINSVLQSDFNLYGIDKFKYEILEEVQNTLDLLDKEEEWINRGCNLYNKHNAKMLITEIPEKHIKRFWTLVDKTNGTDNCWNYTGCINQTGYGEFAFRKNGKKLSYKAHRVAYYLLYPETSINLIICHKCNNRACCNPNHLMAGSYKDNYRDVVDSDGKKLNWIIVNQIRAFFHEHPDILPNELKECVKYAYGLDLNKCYLINIGMNKNWRDKNYNPPNRKFFNTGVYT